MMKTVDIVGHLTDHRGASMNPHDDFSARVCAMIFRNEPQVLYKALMQGPTVIVQTRFHDHPDAGERFIDVRVTGNPDRVRVAIDYDEKRDYADRYRLGQVIGAGRELASCPCKALP